LVLYLAGKYFIAYDDQTAVLIIARVQFMIFIMYQKQLIIHKDFSFSGGVSGRRRPLFFFFGGPMMKFIHMILKTSP